MKSLSRKWKCDFTIGAWIVFLFFVFNVQKIVSQSEIRFADSVSVKDSLLTKIQRDSSSVDTIPFDSLYEATTVQQFLRTSGAFFSPADSSLLRIFYHDDLMKYYHGDFADLLWNIAGFYIHDLGSYGKPISASVNGLSNRHVLLMIDGVPLNDPDNGWANLNVVTLENIDRIEFFRGNASALYGDAASGGYIHIIKRDFEAQKPLTSMKFRSAFSSFEDIGIFFGRNLGRHIRISGGGSSKQTPGEQNIQGFLGGFQRNIQSTRYTGRSLFFNADVYFQRNWSFNFYTQGNRDKYDAYGRNRFGDLNAFDFVNVEGFRKDERTDYHFGLTRRDGVSLLQSKLYFVNINRKFDNFSIELIPGRYSVHSVGTDTRYSRRIGNNTLQGGVTYERQTLNRIETAHAEYTRYAFFVSDQWTVENFIFQPSARWQHHSVFNSTIAMNLNSAIKINSQINFTLNAGYAEITPPLIDEIMTGQEKNSQIFGTTLPKRFLIDQAATALLKNEKLYTFSSGIRIEKFFTLDRVALDGYANRIRDGIYYNALHFNQDTMRVEAGNFKKGNTYGLDVEAIKKIGFIQFTARQSFFTGTEAIRSGLPPYRTYLSGYGEMAFINKNLIMTGLLNAMYFSSHAGFTFQDAPQVYFNTPRRARGGWIFNTRITARIGDLQIFYEAENFLRARFTLLDGYDVTPQQIRVGLIWKMFN